MVIKKKDFLNKNIQNPTCMGDKKSVQQNKIERDGKFKRTLRLHFFIELKKIVCLNHSKSVA